MSDIVERLRKVDSSGTRKSTKKLTTNWHRNPDGPEAADEIGRLRLELCQSEGRCETLRARLAEAERDAARYRWLRADECDADEISRRCSLFEATYDEHLDAAIDAAMGKP